MTLQSQLDRWEQQGTVSPERHSLLSGLSRDEPCSLFLPLNFLLYAGVVALVGGTETTLKRFFREAGNVVRLQPANAAMSPIRVPAHDVQIQGRLLAVLRKY